MNEEPFTLKDATEVKPIISLGGTLIDQRPDYHMTFYNTDGMIGKLDFNGPTMIFTGEVEESAQEFMDFLAKSFVGRLEAERAAERERIAGDYNHVIVRGV